MSWMADHGGMQVSTPKKIHPNARAGNGCPWAQDSDVQQFKRGPPSRRESYGNPINHTGYQAAPSSARASKKAVNQRGDGAAPWALEQNLNTFAAPTNAIGSGLGGAGTKAFNGTFQQGAPAQAMYQQQYEGYGDNSSQPGSSYAQYAQPLPDDDGGDDGYGYLDMPPQAMPPQQQQQQQVSGRQRQDQAGGCPWAVSYDSVMQSESRSQFAGMTGAPAFQAQRVLKPRATPPRGGGMPADENFNMLHDSSNVAVESKSDNLAKQEAMLQRGQAAALDARFAAQAIRNKMRSNENCISWQ
uniref:Uncharacterized protein n=1 Tax=Hemiselmis andersenii TaxID=464988 RepID=A0A6T8GGZ5_HEMAN|eukprot:CAMPEP_0114130842 /NCGR_PEP_ID=MMETSP0043_2-20121206/12235_1 /TAXON_ID=464988 /ORGANISM="Hemiselmis andersenii, Strain CCMP644" /LENGTH=299 /DNA_ID=CAMNT_0001224233 /DNA_START=72 /DNA_END=971 /DNA_ORIENTATION=+